MNTKDSGPISLRIAGAQIAVQTDIEANVKTLLRAIDFAAGQQADSLLTPEGSLSGYTHEFSCGAARFHVFSCGAASFFVSSSASFQPQEIKLEMHAVAIPAPSQEHF